MNQARSYTQSEIENAICINYGITQPELLTGKIKDAVKIRIYFMFKYLTPNKNEISKIIKHSECMVRYNIKETENKMETERMFRIRINEIINILNNGI